MNLLMKKHGTGIHTFANGDQYIGNWENDSRKGTGVYIWSSGNKYEGEWEADK